MAAEEYNRHQTGLFFKSAAADDETFQVIRFTGEEAISRPYHFEIELVSDDPDIDMERMIGMPARLTIEKDGDRRYINGLLKTFEQGDEAKAGRYYYHAELVPRLWLMTLSLQNQIYQNKSVPEIIREELLATQNKGASSGISGKDFELRLTQQYSKREYVVQYAESDFSFISRLMEHEGLFYFFEQERDREKLVITDNNIHLKPIDKESNLAYRSAAGMSSGGESAIREFACRRLRIPGQVVLKDYNYRLPHLPLQAEVSVDPASHGLVCSYGDHFKVPEEGQALAKIRSQEILARQTIFQGQSDCIHFQAASKFKLEDHFRTSYNKEYILTVVRHKGSQMLSGIADQAADESIETDYRSSFEAISADVAYRPERVTPKPKLYGIMNAHVDSALMEDRAEIDEQGRYKVVMPFDLSGTSGGKATRYIRMAQPYGGHNQGMHFPLRKNTEVIWTCIDGDPDRPIIIGAVPNPMTPSVVNSDNHTRNIIKTSHGSFIEFNDGKGNGAAPATSPGTPGGNLKPQQNQQRLSRGSYPHEDGPGALQPAASELYSPEPRSRKSAPSPALNTDALARQQQRQPNGVTYSESDPGGGKDVWFRVKVPEYQVIRDEQDNVVSKYQSYLRLGTKADNETSLADYEKNFDQNDKNNAYVAPVDGPDGWLDYTDGNHISIAQGHRKVLTGGNKSEVVNGTYKLTINEGGMEVSDAQPFYNIYYDKMGGTYRKRELQYLDEMNFTTGTSYNMFVGSKVDANIAAALDLNLGLKADLGAVLQYEHVLGPSIHVSSNAETKANNMVLLRVEPENQKFIKLGSSALKILAILGGVLGTGAIARNAANNSLAKDAVIKDGRLSTALASGGAAVAAAAIVFGLNQLIRSGKKRWMAAESHSTMIKMDKDVIEIDNQAGKEKNEKIELKCGDSSITLHADGRIIIKGENISLNGTKSINASSEKQINILADQTGETKIGGKEVIIESAAKTTLASKIKTVIEANAGVDLGGPDTAGAKIQQAQLAAKKLLQVPPSDIGPKKASMPPKKG